MEIMITVLNIAVIVIAVLCGLLTVFSVRVWRRSGGRRWVLLSPMVSGAIGAVVYGFIAWYRIAHAEGVPTVIVSLLSASWIIFCLCQAVVMMALRGRL